jgi:hypothetical protein
MVRAYQRLKERMIEALPLHGFLRSSDSEDYDFRLVLACCSVDIDSNEDHFFPETFHVEYWVDKTH